MSLRIFTTGLRVSLLAAALCNACFLRAAIAGATHVGCSAISSTSSSQSKPPRSTRERCMPSLRSASGRWLAAASMPCSGTGVKATILGCRANVMDSLRLELLAVECCDKRAIPLARNVSSFSTGGIGGLGKGFDLAISTTSLATAFSKRLNVESSGGVLKRSISWLSVSSSSRTSSIFN